MGLAGESAWWPRNVPQLDEKEYYAYGFKDNISPKIWKKFKKMFSF